LTAIHLQHRLLSKPEDLLKTKVERSCSIQDYTSE
jgi:hypothetical protein